MRFRAQKSLDHLEQSKDEVSRLPVYATPNGIAESREYHRTIR